jgi:hypothetical protein
MVVRRQIGDFVFIAQTTYYMYVAGCDKPVLTTSDKDLFNKQKRAAQKGRIAARKQKRS